jgi:hypothetical protein
MAVLWVVAPCSPVEVCRRFRGACCLHYEGDDDAGGSKHLRNVGRLLADCARRQARRQPSSYSPLREREISTTTSICILVRVIKIGDIILGRKFVLPERLRNTNLRYRRRGWIHVSHDRGRCLTVVTTGVSLRVVKKTGDLLTLI